MTLVKKRYFLSLLVLLVVSAYSLIHEVNSKNIDMFLNDKTELIYLEYQKIYYHHHQIADLIFSAKIQEPQVIKLFKNREREKLYKYLLDDYKEFKNYNVRQLHFHLPNNNSFLRMHRPSKFGDNISKVRPTVKYVNEIKKPIDGFEEGKIFNGFRFVYPLFDGKRHIGSVEISFSALSFIKEMDSNYKVRSNLLISRDVVNQKVLKSEQSNYVQSPLSGYYFEKSIIEYINMDFSKKVLSEEEADNIHTKIDKGEPFSMYMKDMNLISTFVPMKNPITNKVVASMVFYSNDLSISSENQHSVRLFLISILIIGLILLLIYKEIKNRESLHQKIKERTKELLVLNKKLEEMAHVDSLTGAYNRRYLYEIAKKLIPFVKRENQALCVAMMDLDKFKDVNDTYGHDVGDEVLKVFVENIQNSIRESDIFIRYGGEEFLLVLPNTDLKQAQIITEKLRKLIEECEEVDGLRFTISIGVSAFIVSEDNLDSLLKKSDEALYIAKESGRNRVICSGQAQT